MALQDLTPQLRKRLGRVERLAGLFVTFAAMLALAGFGYFLKTTAKNRGWFVPTVPYYTYIRDATGVQVGSPIKMMGFTIGEVIKVDQMPMERWYIDNSYFVFVSFKVRAPYFGYILEDSEVRLGSGDLLGTRTLEVLRGNYGIVTVTNETAKLPAVLVDKYAYETDPEKRKKLIRYTVATPESKGFYLRSIEAQPLPEKLTVIANDIHSSLPGVFALTNQVQQAFSNIHSITVELDKAMPRIQGAIGETENLLKEFRPVLQKPGGLGELLLPTNLNAEVTGMLSNLNSRAELITPLLSNVNAVVEQVGQTVGQLRDQLQRDTNLVGNVSRLADDASQLAITTDTLLRRHWLFRSAFKTNESRARSTPSPMLNPRSPWR